MDAIVQSSGVDDSCEESSRVRGARVLQKAQNLGFWWHSPRQVAMHLGVSDNTLRFQLRRLEELIRDSELPPSAVRFLESPEGIQFLHILLVALHLVFVLANDCGLRAVGWFLRLTGLDKFIASSYGAQQSFAAELETKLGEYGREEEAHLAAAMPHQDVSLCLDETFHPQICLVGIEPVSNYLLLEQYASQRDADTWQQRLDERLGTWPVTVCQVTSDEDKALVALAEQRLGAHHSPDLFHVQHDTVQATSLVLAGQTRRAHEAVADAERRAVQQRGELAACQEQCPQSAQIAEFQQQLEQTVASEAAARQRLADCQQRQQQATEARHGLSHDYHPIDLETGQPVTAAEVVQRLGGHFDRLDEIARDASLSVNAKEKLAKARRLLTAMQSTIAFFWATVLERLAAWQLTETVVKWLREELIPAVYLERVAEKAGTSAERKRLRTRASEILARARSPDGVWGTLSDGERMDLMAKARECANLFQRSSSCVEGRNGQLSLRHHGLHRLMPRKLAALRVLHNFMIERPDGTTPAERFFGARPKQVFAWLLTRLPLPGLPRPHRAAA